MTLPFFMPEANSSILLPEAIRKLGIGTSLQLSLDVRDKDSYTSGQKWLDRSGSGYDFFLGADNSATATDPTFTGTAGMPGAYFAFDGGDYFTYDTTNETWMDNLHKNNAAATFVCWVRPASGANYLLGTLGATFANIGVQIYCNTTGALHLDVGKTGGVAAFSSSSSIGVTASEWQMLAISYDEAANTILWHRNATSASAACTFTTPSASAASFPMQIGALGNAAGSLFMASGARMAGVAMWSRALTTAELAALFNETRAGFGV